MITRVNKGSDSPLILKDDERNDINLKLLKTHIDLGDSKSVYEERNDRKRKIKSSTVRREPIRVMKEVKRNERKVTDTVTTVKENDSSNSEIDIDSHTEKDTDITKEINSDTSETSDLKSVTTSSNTKIKSNTAELQKWKQNALTIFENSYVYPFVHTNNKYKCFVCSKAFLSPTLLREHSEKDHNFEELKKELTKRVRDKNIKVDVSLLKCRLCSNTLSNFNELKFHLKEHGKVIDPEFQDNIIPFKLEGNTFDCQLCGQSYLKLRLLIIHMSRHFNNFSCEFCGSVFISLNYLRRHLQTHQLGSFPCDKCEKVFSNSAKRTLHIRGVHLKQFPRRCPICPERFNSNYQRTKHLRIVHNQSTGLFRCETCGKEYDLKYHLLIHIRSVHLQERNHECPICRSRFFSKYCLTRHMSVHTGQKNFMCLICGKAYARMKNLKEHSKTHDVKKECYVCGKEFGDPASLADHERNVHGLTPF